MVYRGRGITSRLPDVNNAAPPPAPPEPRQTVYRGRRGPLPHSMKQGSFTEHQILPEGIKMARKGIPVMYGDVRLDNPQAIYPLQEKQNLLKDEQGNTIPAKANPAFWESINIGYTPSYWEDPRHVAQAYIKLKSTLPGEQAPEWMDTKAVEDAYKYLSYANGEDSWANWKYLSPDDPGRQFLQSIQAPPLEYVLNPHQMQEVYFSNALAKKPVERTPDDLVNLDPYHQNLLSQYDNYNAQSDLINQHSPAWQKIMTSVMDNPVLSGLAQTAPIAGLALLSGNPLLAGGMLVSGAGIGAAQNVRNPYLASALAGASFLLPFGMMTGNPLIAGATALGGAGAGVLYNAVTGRSAANDLMGLMDMPAELTETILGTLVQGAGTLYNPEQYGTPQEFISNFGSLRSLCR